MTNRPNANRARLVLILAGLIIFAGEISAGFLIDHAPLEIRFPEVANIVKSSQSLRDTKNILFFGTSRFKADVNAESVIQDLNAAGIHDSLSAFNAAVTAGDPVAMEFVSEKLLAAGICPSVAVIEVLPETVSRRNSWLGLHLTRQFRWPDVWGALPDASRAGRLYRLLSSRLIPLSMFRSEFQQWALRALNLRFSSSALGGGNELSGAPTRQREMTPADLLEVRVSTARERLRNFKIGGLSAAALEKLIRRYRKLQTTIILISAPVPTQYRNEYRPAIDAAFLTYMQWLAETYGVQFFDYRHRLPDHLFRATYYLTAEGQSSFNRLVAREILVPSLSRVEGYNRKTPNGCSILRETSS